MAAMWPKHVAMNHSFVALNIVCFIVVVCDVNLYIIIRNVNLDAIKVTLCLDLTAAVTKPAPLVLFADPQKAITRSGYFAESKYGVARATDKNRKRNWEQTDKQNNWNRQTK